MATNVLVVLNRSNLLANKLIAYNSSKGLFVLGTNLQYTYEIPSDENSTAIATTEWVKNRISEIPLSEGVDPSIVKYKHNIIATFERPDAAYEQKIDIAFTLENESNETITASNFYTKLKEAIGTVNYIPCVGRYYVENPAQIAIIRAIAGDILGAVFKCESVNKPTEYITTAVNPSSYSITSLVDYKNTPAGVSMIPDTGNATSLSVPSSGGTVYIEANGWLCVNLNKTTGDGQFLSMTVTNSSGTDVWGGVNKNCSYFSNNYPIEFLPVKAGDYVKFQYTVTLSRILLIKTL